MNGARVEFAVVIFQEITDQLRNVGSALSQRWHVKIDDVDAVEQIGAEGAVGDFFFELAVSGTDHADFDFLVFLGANAAELAVLQKLQEFGLQGHIELGDFIEKQGAAVGHFDAAGLGAVGAGKGSFFIAEEFAFEQRSGNCRAIYFDPWTGFPRRGAMDHARDDVLASAALSVNKYGYIGASNLSQALTERSHGVSGTEDDGIGGHFAEGLDQGADGIR